MMTDLRPVELQHQGLTLKGQLAIPDSVTGKLAAVMVVHDAMGLGEFTRDKARLLANTGYVALATDMYGNGAYSNDTAEAGKHFAAFQNNPELLRSRVALWFEYLGSLPEVDPNRIAAIGYCFGGHCVLELARSGADVKAVVSFHGLLSTTAPAEPGTVRAQIAVFTGSRDPYVPLEQVDALRAEMNAAGVAFQLTEFSEAYHAFTNPNSPRGVGDGMKYDALCDQLSWAGMTTLLRFTLS